MNDGGTLLTTTLKMSTLRPLAAATTLVAGVTVAPAIAGTRVATTLSERLVSFSGTDGPIAMLLAVLSATVVVIGLSWRGFPTSLTVALVGGIVGVGVGASLPISWRSISVVLLVAALAPLAGFAGGLALSRLWQHAPSWFRVGDQVRHAHRLGFLLQTLAYGTNDGQKMLGVFAVALPVGVSDGGVVPMWPVLLTIGALFAVGIPAGIQRIGTRIGSDVLLGRLNVHHDRTPPCNDAGLVSQP